MILIPFFLVLIFLQIVGIGFGWPFIGALFLIVVLQIVAWFIAAFRKMIIRLKAL